MNTEAHMISAAYIFACKSTWWRMHHPPISGIHALFSISAEETMPILRSGAIQNFLRQLDQGMLSQHSFECSFNNADGRIISVSFRDAPTFSFSVLHPESNTNSASQWQTIESPGQFFVSDERYEFRDFASAQSRVGPWVARLLEELATSQQHSTKWLATLRSNLETTADSLAEPDTPFTESEIEDWSAKLDELVSRLERLESENQIQRGTVSRLKDQLEELVERGQDMPRRTWLKTAGHKILDVFEHGARSGVEALAKGAVKALLESLK